MFSDHSSQRYRFALQLTGDRADASLVQRLSSRRRQLRTTDGRRQEDTRYTPQQRYARIVRVPKLVVAAFIAWVAVRATAADGPAAPRADQPPKPTGLNETVEKRLVQLDVGVEGDRDAIRGITAKDFVFYVGEHEVQGLIVDHLCGDERPPGPAKPDDRSADKPKTVAVPPITRPRATFVFFFDQPHLTQAGRALSLETARDLITRLVVDGTRASIVSSSKRLETIVPLTEDRAKLVAGLERLRGDPRQWESYSETEQGRVDDLMDECKRSPYGCLPLATSYAREEWHEARRSTERLGITVGTLAEASMPKALVYFGDTLRQRAGLHYLYVAAPPSDPVVASAEMVPSAAAEFDAVINEALARGVHFFTIQAEGRPGLDAVRHRHAQDALVGLAAETGGEAFLGGASLEFIARRITARTSCTLLLSFPPGDLPRDTPLGVTLELHVPNVKIQKQGRIVVPSPASIEHARLVAAFVDPASSDDGSLRVLVIPRGGDGNVWKASVQLRLRPTGVPDSSAELGASIVRHDTVADHFASSIATKSGTRAMVLEKSLDFAPGEFSVVAVARDAKRGDIGSSRLDADWPSPAKSAAAIVPIAVLQAGPAAMSKDGAFSSSGFLAHDVDELLDPAASITLETVVCRGGRTSMPVVVERWVEDELANEFVPMTIDATGDPCVQIVDVVRAGRLRPGVVDYRVAARIGDEIVAQERRALRVGSGMNGR